MSHHTIILNFGYSIKDLRETMLLKHMEYNIIIEYSDVNIKI